LLAKAVYQSTSLLSDLPLSRASPLPHLIRSGIKIGIDAGMIRRRKVYQA
jgi:hypothetical protein